MPCGSLLSREIKKLFPVNFTYNSCIKIYNFVLYNITNVYNLNKLLLAVQKSTLISNILVIHFIALKINGKSKLSN